MKKHKIKHKNQAFTLIELLVVVSIIGLLSAVVLISMNSARVKANNARRLADTRQIGKAYEIYYANHGVYPYANGPLPVAALAPYAKVIATALTAGPNSYFASSRSPGSPITKAISDDGSGCLIVHDGYFIAVGIVGFDEETLNDGGIEPFYYETFGGNVEFFRSGVPGTYTVGSPC